MGQIVMAEEGFVGPDWLPKAVGQPDGNSLHDPFVEMKKFPLDEAGNIDWVKTLNMGLIQPKGFLAPVEDLPPPDFNIVRIVTGTMPDVVFPHKTHLRFLHCSNCHPKIFKMGAGANPITMDKVRAGEYCGRCHGKVAFPITMTTCYRCHSRSKDPKYSGPRAFLEVPSSSQH